MARATIDRFGECEIDQKADRQGDYLEIWKGGKRISDPLRGVTSDEVCEFLRYNPGKVVAVRKHNTTS